ncbi:S-layer family protein [Tumebacillus sp. BK434]|uniref:S-layer homology domain-containing protein n=1 Tax=Tumebacillus sp. BK434 TaxID=2512169 RepID=UPI0010D5B81B|nr:S-layer homology domain-containing protein [Tumebacillus sp. BK434]TCP57771.1 S-layer family protein [Tumebacillus sp. BK434]
MNKSKKLTAAVAATAVASAIVAPVASASVSFSDINGSYAKDAILELANAGIIVGENGKFNPSANIKRQDFAIIMAKALKLDLTNAPKTATFSDVPTTHYSYAAVEAAVKAGLLSGTGNGNFGLGTNLTREQMAVVFVNALGVDVSGLGAGLKFADASSISAWAKDAVAFAVEAKLLSGDNNNKFNPAANAERQQVAVVASNFLKAQEVYKAAQLKAVTLKDNSTVEISFTKAVESLTAADIKVAVKGTNTEVAISGLTLSADKKSATFTADFAGSTTYTVTYGGKSAEVTTAATNAVEVTNVTALNLKQIKVDFNQAVDAASATASANYTYTGAVGNGYAAEGAFVLSADKKSVIITLLNAEAQQASATLKIKDVVAGDNKLAEVTKSVSFFDATVPSVTTATVTGPSKVTVEFSEPVTAGALNASAFSLDGNTYSLSSATAVVGEPNKVELTIGATLPEGEHTIKINPAGTDPANQVKDFAGFVVPTADVKFTYTVDKTAPVAVIDSVAQNQVVIKFNKAITNTGAISVYHTYNNIFNYRGTSSWSVDGKTLTVTFADAPLAVGTATIFVNNASAGSAADAWGNKFASTTLTATVASDVTAPTVTSVKQVDSTNIDVTFSKAVEGANIASNYVLKDADGEVVEVKSATKQGNTNVYRLNTAILNGGSYTLSIGADLIKDTSYNKNKLAAYTATVSVTDKVAPEVMPSGVFASDTKKVQINFSEAMTDAALNASNYLIAYNGIAKQSLPTGSTVTWGASKSSVIITFPSAQAGLVSGTSKVFVAQLADLAGNKTEGFQNEVTLSTDNIALANVVAGSVKATARDTIEFQLNTALTAINVANFTINGVAATAASYVNNDGKATVTVKAPAASKFATNLSDLNASAITISANGVTSAFGTQNSGTVTIAKATVKDTVAPEITGYATVDANNNGKIDAVTVTFSEDLYVASVQESDFTIEGYTITGVALSAGNVVTISVKENSVIDADATPKVTLVGAVSDNSAQRNSLGAQAAVAATDSIAAFITGAVYSVSGGNHYVTVTFSEGVTDENGAALDATDFVLTDGGAGTATIANAVHNAKSKSVVLQVSEALTDGALVNAVATKVKDAAGNVSATATFAVTGLN